MSEATATWGTRIQNIFEKFLPQESKTPDLVQPFLDEVAAIVAQVSDSLKDGFQWKDLHLFGTIVPELVALAGKVGNLSDADKKEFVIDLALSIYVAVDGGPDGSLNRIDIPILFGGLEKRFESWIIRTSIGFAYEAAAATLTKFGLQNAQPVTGTTVTPTAPSQG